MNIHEAVVRCRDIQAQYPYIYVSGSVALILGGVLPEREIKDLDFACKKGEHHSPPPENGQSKCNIVLCDTPCCLFENPEIVAGPVVDGLRLWDLKDIIRYKEQYNRKKDQADIQAIKEGAWPSSSQ